MHATLITVLLGLSLRVAESPQPVESTEPAPVVTAKAGSEPRPIQPSMFGARVIEPGRVLYGLQGWYAVSSAFLPAARPMIGFGLGGGFDVVAGLDVTVPPFPQTETMEALGITVRRAGPDFTMLQTAFTLELVGAHFGSKESAENLAGPRHATGLRDLNVGFGAPITWGHGINITAKPFVMASIDLQPASNGPLTGAPPAWTMGWTFGLDIGDELVLARVLGGLRVRPGIQMLLHTRRDDRTVTLLTTMTISAG
jgi:hypothetical protein